jgi:hypothetical protein
MRERERVVADVNAPLSAEDFERAVGLIEELHDTGRIDEATAVYKLVVATERAGLRPPAPVEDDEPGGEAKP